MDVLAVCPEKTSRRMITGRDRLRETMDLGSPVGEN
jgi:hypothetical protein